MTAKPYVSKFKVGDYVETPSGAIGRVTNVGPDSTGIEFMGPQNTPMNMEVTHEELCFTGGWSLAPAGRIAEFSTYVPRIGEWVRTKDGRTLIVTWVDSDSSTVSARPPLQGEKDEEISAHDLRPHVMRWDDPSVGFLVEDVSVELAKTLTRRNGVEIQATVRLSGRAGPETDVPAVCDALNAVAERMVVSLSDSEGEAVATRLEEVGELCDKIQVGDGDRHQYAKRALALIEELPSHLRDHWTELVLDAIRGSNDDYLPF